MAATGSLDTKTKEIMLKAGFVEGNSFYGPVRRIAAFNGVTFIAAFVDNTPIFEWNSTDNKLQLVSGETFTISIPQAATIDKIELGAELLSVPGEFVEFATISLGADSVTFQGPGNYTITQLDIDLA